MTDPDPINELLAEQRIVREAANASFVDARLKQAHDNVASAELVNRSNALASTTLAYDAMRFAVDAHMQAHGLRIASRPGAHRAAVIYARERMSDLVDEKDLDSYEALREVRNRIEYPNPGARNTVTTADSDEIVRAARRLADAVIRWWIAYKKRTE
jgi:hypothetical protein